MVIAKGVIAHAVLPLALAGGGLMASIGKLQTDVAARYDTTRTEVRRALRLDWQPQSNAPRSSGEIAVWQRRDASVRDSEVATDYRGNIYVQDDKTGKLRVLKLEPGFKLERESGDWMSRKLTDQAANASHLP
jgi:hypothetical protein